MLLQQLCFFGSIFLQLFIQYVLPLLPVLAALAPAVAPSVTPIAASVQYCGLWSDSVVTHRSFGLWFFEIAELLSWPQNVKYDGAQQTNVPCAPAQPN